MGRFFTDFHKLKTVDDVEVVDIYSDRDCATGDELLEAYGESNNVFLAQWFGFAPNPNPSDFISLKWLFKPGRGSHTEEKLAMLNLFRGEIQTTFKIRKIDRFADSVISYLKITTLPPVKMSSCSKSKDKEALLKCISDHNGPEIYDELITVLREKLQRYRTTLAADQKQIEHARGLPSSNRLMIEVRIHHKMIAKHALELAKTLKKRAEGKLEL